MRAIFYLAPEYLLASVGMESGLDRGERTQSNSSAWTVGNNHIICAVVVPRQRCEKEPYHTRSGEGVEKEANGKDCKDPKSQLSLASFNQREGNS